MKKYKLKKWYPSLPKEITEGTIVEYYEVLQGYSDHPSQLHCIVTIDEDEVEENPDFWEKVSAEYEIISFTDGFNDYIKVNDLLFTINTSRNYEAVSLLSNPNIKIKKVKRLEDGKVFSLGDSVKSKNSNNNHIIKEFSVKKRVYSRNPDLSWNFVDKEEIYVTWENNEGGNWLNAIFPYSPLFTTVDGVDIYENDTFYVVNNIFYNIQETTGGNFQKDVWKNYRFSSLEHAKIFASKNNPCLSIKEICDTITINSTQVEDLRYKVIKKML